MLLVSQAILGGSTFAGTLSISGYNYYQSLLRDNRSCSPSLRAAAARNARWIDQNFTCSWANIREGRTWTLFTSAFLHERMFSLAMSGMGLFSFSGAFISMAGARPFIPVFFSGVLAKNMAGLGLDVYEKGARVLDGTAARPVEGVMNWKDKSWKIGSGEHEGTGLRGGITAMATAVVVVAPSGLQTFFMPLPIMLPGWMMLGSWVGIGILSDRAMHGNDWDPKSELGSIGLGLVVGLIFRRRAKMIRRFPLYQ